MSPLIDCVFLLLIFFLVTSMLKRFERQIPIDLADPTAAVALEPASDTSYLGIGRDGQVYTQDGRDNFGVLQFAPIARSLPDVLGGMAAEGLRQSPVELVVEPGTPFQQVIDVLDVFELQGFDRVRPRVRARPFRPDDGEGGTP